jgi:hypothetical protein
VDLGPVLVGRGPADDLLDGVLARVRIVSPDVHGLSEVDQFWKSRLGSGRRCRIGIKAVLVLLSMCLLVSVSLPVFFDTLV